MSEIMQRVADILGIQPIHLYKDGSDYIIYTQTPANHPCPDTVFVISSPRIAFQRCQKHKVLLLPPEIAKALYDAVSRETPSP